MDNRQPNPDVDDRLSFVGAGVLVPDTSLVQNRQAYFLSLLEAVNPNTIWGMAVDIVRKNPTAENLERLLDQLASQYRDNPGMMVGIVGDELAAFIAFHGKVAPAPKPEEPVKSRYVRLVHDVRSLAIGARFRVEFSGPVHEVVDRKRNVTHYEEIRPGRGRRPRSRHFHHHGPLRVYLVNQQTPTI